MIADSPDQIRMVGSLRASQNCLDCHSVRRGELLGALTYELIPVRPMTVQKKGARATRFESGGRLKPKSVASAVDVTSDKPDGRDVIATAKSRW